jgi:fatty-acyl-CoA synthase
MSAFERSILGNLPTLAAQSWGDREALCFEDRRWSFAEFSRAVDQCAKGLIAIGVAPGERVAVWMVNRPEWLLLMYAVARVGAVIVPLNTRYRSEDVAYAAAQSRCGTLIVNARSGPVDYAAMLDDSMPDLAVGREGALQLSRYPDLKRLIVLGECTLPNVRPWESMVAAGAAVSDDALLARAAAVDGDDALMVLYTSGTTGDPKGAVHTHAVIRNTWERAKIYGMNEADVHMNYMPLFHLYGFSEIAIIALMTGGRQVLMSAFDADQVLDLAEAEAATILHGFDAHWLDLLAAQDARPRRLAMRFGTYPSGTDASVDVCRRVQEVFGPTLSGWGMTEAWGFVACNSLDDSVEQRTAASGMPMPGYEFRVVDPDTGVDLPDESPGELLARGYAQMREYFDKPQETAETIIEGGWVRTGDMVRRRADGHIVFMGRYKDILKIGGENVAPAEIEARLLTLDGVRDAAVVGAPDRRLGEIPAAFLLVAPECKLRENDVIESCRGRIASFKIPRRVFFVDALPMTPSGKVRKVELRAEAAALIERADGEQGGRP